MATTIRPNTTNGNGSTVRPASAGASDSNQTVRPGSISATIRPGAQSGKGSTPTARPYDPSTLVPHIVDVNKYQPRQSYTIAGVEYKVLKALSLTSGEAQVFLVTDPKGAKQVLKLYYKGAIPNAAILNKVKSADGSGLFFKVHSHGAFEDRYYELMKYYDGENLEDVDTRRNEATIMQYIGKMASAIDLCHQLGFIHRDIKPSNFIFESSDRKNILLGDFGIAVECDSSGMCVADMARTKIYAAPEVYLNTGDGKARFNTKSDFYSLGIAILYLWMGKDAFSHFEKENELQLATMKAYGNLPIPSAMPLRLFSLVKALIEPNPDNRAGFKEIEAWLKGGNPFGTPETAAAKPAAPAFEVVFKQGQTAHSPKELARFMMEDKQLAISYLYKGRITVWFENNKLPELAIKMEQIKEDLYSNDQAAGLQAACYILNPALPFTDVVGRSCTTSAEIAESILKNFDMYLSQISNKANSALLIYLQTHGLEQAVADFRKQFANNPRFGLLYLAYRLDPSLPWRVTDETGEPETVDTCDELLNWACNNNPSEQTQSDIVTEAFFLWIHKRNAVAAAAIQPLIKDQGDKENFDGVLYRLNPKTGLYFVIDENSPKYIFTINDFANFLNVWYMQFLNGQNSKSSSIVMDVIDILHDKKTNFYHFLQSKGTPYAKYIDWIKYCLDENSEDNTKKAGPYSDVIGFFRLIKGMGGKVYYEFKSGKKIYHPSELPTVAKSDIDDALSKDLRPLEAWISVFYQEDPDLDKSPKYAYERKTSEYVNFLISQGIITPEVQRYIDSKAIVEERAEKTREAIDSIKKGMKPTLWLSVVPIALAGILLLFLWRPEFNSLKFGTVFKTTTIFFFILACLASRLKVYVIGEAVMAASGGLVSTIAILFVNWLFPGAIPYLAGGLLIVIAVLIAIVCLTPEFKEKENDDIINPDFEHLELEPLYQAFHPGAKEFDSSIGDRATKYLDELGNNKQSIQYVAIPWGILTILAIIYFLLIGKPIGEPKKDARNAVKTEQVVNFSQGLSGKWAGTLNDIPVNIEFYRTPKPDLFTFFLTGWGDGTPIKFSGVFNSANRELDLTDTDLENTNVSGTLTLKKNLIYGNIYLRNTKSKAPMEILPFRVQYEPEPE